MSQKHLKLGPLNIAPEFWIYEENHGLTVVVRHQSSDGKIFYHTKQYRIPWCYLRRALVRKNRRWGDAE